MLNFKKHRKQVCVNCHFLKLTGGVPPGSNSKVLNNKERAEIRKGNFDIANFYGKEKPLVFMCYREFWDEGINGKQGLDRSNESRKKIINETSRKKDRCFREFSPGMSWPKAEELQKEDNEKKQERNKLILKILGLVIAAILAIAAVINIIIILTKK